jgi:hypothetical protein
MEIDVPEQIGGLPFFPLAFDKGQRLVEPEQVAAVRDHLRQGETTDLLVVSHGWNNDAADALRLYRRLLTNVGQQARGRWDDREVAVLAVFWPSKRFADRDLIPGGAAELSGDVPTAVLLEEIEELRGSFDDEHLDRLRELAPRLVDSREARRGFAEAVRELVDVGEDEEVDDEIPSGFFSIAGADMIEELGMPRDEEVAAIGGGREGGIAVVGEPEATGGVTTGGAAFLGSTFSGLRSGARNALNLATYYTMKQRAGDTGRRGVAPVLRQLRQAVPDLRLHLVGHSFGGRLVAAAALGEDDTDPALPVDSVTLLQAAFSHHGFAEDYEPGKHGFFRNVLSGARVRGPLVVTHTHNDRANTWAYPMASRLRRQRAAMFGGPNDPYGAIGSNGALKTPGAEFGELLPADGDYRFGPGEIRNLEASAFIPDHNTVHGAEVAHSIVSVVEATYR